MHRCRHLMVALPETNADTGLIAYAAMLARLGAAVEIRFVHILPPSSESSEARDRALVRLETKVSAAFADVPEMINVYCNVLKGPLTDRLLEFAVEQEVDMILLGHQPTRSGYRALARRLAMQAPCSVWMVPDGSPAEFKRILIPIDFSEQAADALSVAVSLARLAEVRECTALHVYFNPAVATFQEYDNVMQGQEYDVFEQFVNPIERHGVRIEPLFEEGPKVSQVIGRIVDERKIDLVVMGTRGRSSSSAILLGSEAEQTIIETRVPVLTVKHFGAHLNLLQALLDKKFFLKNDPRFG